MQAVNGDKVVSLQAGRCSARAHNPGLPGSTPGPATSLGDASSAALFFEPDCVLHELALGRLGATRETQRLAQAELAQRWNA